MSAVAVESLPEGQKLALEGLRSIAEASDGALTVDLDYRQQMNGYLTVRVYLSSASLLPSEHGVDLEDWEPIDIQIPERFPYEPPIAWGGRDDFPELPHQAWGSGFCVWVEDSNWDATAGMPGFLRAVIDTYQKIALGTLQGHLQPWRPPDHCYHGKGCAVIKADLPASWNTELGTSFRWAAGIEVDENRIDVIEWLDVNDKAADVAELLARELARLHVNKPDAFLMPAIVMAKPIAIEYFDVWPKLLFMLQEQGVDKERLAAHVATAETVGRSPAEGGAEAAVLFRVAADTGPTAAGQDARFAVGRLNQSDARLLPDICRALEELDSLDELPEEFLELTVDWVRVYDGRLESVLRRAAERPTSKLAGAKILLLGCGGLGAPIAEHCVRSGAACVRILDSGFVSPGVLSRQPYEDADIGKPKAEALASPLGPDPSRERNHRSEDQYRPFRHLQ